MSGRCPPSFEFLVYIICHPINPVGDIVDLVHLTDNEDMILFSTTIGVILYLHVCSLYCCANRRLEFVCGDSHRWGRDVRFI